MLTLLFCCSLFPLHAVDVYFGTGGRPAEGIYQGDFSPTKGTLKNVRLAAEINAPGFLAFGPDRNMLYAVATPDSEPAVVAYRILADGSLEWLNSQAIGDGGSCHIAVHASGNFLMTAQYSGGSVAVFPIEADGRLAPRSQLHEHRGGSKVDPKRQSSPHPHWVGFSPDGNFAFVPDLGTDQIAIYQVNAERTGIEPHGAAIALPGSGPRHMKFSADGRFIYLLNELSLSVTTFSYDAASGTTQRLSTTPSLSESAKAKESFNSASEILVHPNGKFVYSANRGHDSVTVYRADTQSGALSVIEVEPVRGSWPRNINIDASGHWLFAAGAHSNTVAIFAIDQHTGELQFKRKGVHQIPNVICVLPND